MSDDTDLDDIVCAQHVETEAVLRIAAAVLKSASSEARHGEANKALLSEKRDRRHAATL